jgi:hypothetical protein
MYKRLLDTVYMIISQGINKYIKKDSKHKSSLYTTNPDAKGLCSGKLFYR